MAFIAAASTSADDRIAALFAGPTGQGAMMNGLDAHQHYWRYDARRFGWIDPASALAADHMPIDIRSEMLRHGIGTAIAVQALHDVAETRWLLSLAEQDEGIAGVVGWFDLTSPTLDPDLAALTASKLVGVRHIAQDEPDSEFLLRPDVVAGINTVLAAGKSYDILVYSHQADRVPHLLERLGDGRLILDHCAKPPIASRGWQPWADTLRAIADDPRVWCKISGLVTEADHRHWTLSDIERYFEHALRCFGGDRLIFGSDWPVCTLAASYGDVSALSEELVAKFCPEHRDEIFGGAARRAYALRASDGDRQA